MPFLQNVKVIIPHLPFILFLFIKILDFSTISQYGQFVKDFFDIDSPYQLNIPPSIPPPAHSTSVVTKVFPSCIAPLPAARDTRVSTTKYAAPTKSPQRNFRLFNLFPDTKPPKRVAAT